ncbi:MAG: DUF2807 domain-containing protein [Cyclobacteriaceae bacterium]|nr:DUF2807 domain-containing protein [Cyclobacteriaceae bacterium]
MKRRLIVLFLFTSLLVQAQQAENRSVGSFSGIRVSEGIDVYLKPGDREAVRVEVSGVPLDAVVTEVSGDMLRVQMNSGRYKGNRTVKVYVTFVQLNKLMASSAGNIYSESVIKSRNLSLTASSAATIEVKVDAGELAAVASSAGEIELQGKAERAMYDASSAGEVDAYNVEAVEVKATASSGADIKLTVTQRIEAQASSGASIRYRGNPVKTNTNSSSGGSVKKSD